ncbi:MAG: LiaF-related protein [Gemmatimonadetes bacterium]|nr:LiaF-related protein [Gemmatimonadota bacterium]
MYVGAAEITVTRAGNARASRASLNVGVGSLDYDLDGAWTGDTELSINLALGKFTLRVPPDAGVRVTGNSFLVDFDKAGLEKRGNTWYSPGYDVAKQRVTIQMSAAFGQFNLMRRKNTP